MTNSKKAEKLGSWEEDSSDQMQNKYNQSHKYRDSRQKRAEFNSLERFSLKAASQEEV